MRIRTIISEGLRMVIPKWLRPKKEPSLRELRETVQQTKAEISEHTSFIVEKVQAKKTCKTIEIAPPVANGSH